MARGKDKLRRFAENLTFRCMVQPEFEEVFRTDFRLKGRWREDFFGNPNPVVLELGCGRGEYTVSLAERYPDKNFIGVDIKGARMWRGAKTATEQEMRNAGFLRTRIEFIDSCFAPGEVDEFDYGEPDLEDEQLTEDQKRDMLGLVHDYAMNTSELARTMLDCQHFDDPQVRELVRQTFKDLECAGSHVSDALKLMGWTADDATVG